VQRRIVFRRRRGRGDDGFFGQTPGEAASQWRAAKNIISLRRRDW